MRRHWHVSLIGKESDMHNRFRFLLSIKAYHLLVEEEVIVELKAVERHELLFEAQLLSYLKLTGKRLGLLLNFNVPALRHGIRRIVL
jgi:GxxExxY protein